MRTFVALRAVALAGLAAASATAAHGGLSALADPGWSLPAVAAAAIGVAALLRLLHAAEAARAAAARARHGAAAPAHVPMGLAETAAVMLAAQGCAHVALIAAGAPAHAGQIGALALHTALALLGAAVVWAADRSLTRAVGELGAAIAAAVELLLAMAGRSCPQPASMPAGRVPAGIRRGRAPPAPA
jgi:hypothetical protein